MALPAAFLIGGIFGLGIIASGMSNPAKVLNFFDFFGSWDPSLAFVMGGALAVTFLGYRWVLRRRGPLLDAAFDLPKTRAVEPRLVVGAAIFGLGWGLAGFCPGGALPALGSFQPEVLTFVASMVVGIAVTRLLRPGRAQRAQVDGA